MKKAKKIKGNWVKMIFFLTVIFLCGCSIQAAGQEKKQSRQDEQHYQAMEKEYRNGLKEFLNQAGYRNSGINMTKVITPKEVAAGTTEESETRTYMVGIYNKKINQLDHREREKLMTDLVKVEILMNGCDVSYQFMETDI